MLLLSGILGSNCVSPSSRPETAILIMRDSLADWSRENASGLSLERVDGPPVGPAPTVREMAKRAASLMERTIPFWAEYDRRYISSRPANRGVPPRVRRGGWGFSTAGHFVLEADEAWIVTLSTLGARYLGFQLVDPWGVGLPYVDRSGSLNASHGFGYAQTPEARRERIQSSFSCGRGPVGPAGDVGHP